MGFLDFLNDTLAPDAIFGKGATVFGGSKPLAPIVAPALAPLPIIAGQTFKGAVSAAEAAIGACSASNPFCGKVAAAGASLAALPVPSLAAPAPDVVIGPKLEIGPLAIVGAAVVAWLILRKR